MHATTQAALSRQAMATQREDRALIEELSRKAGYHLTGFFSDEDLEVYFDVAGPGGIDCYVSKGWNQPGFRIATTIRLAKFEDFDLHSIAYVAEICAIQGVCVSPLGHLSSNTWTLESVIYNGSLNLGSFTGSVTAITECARKVCEMVGSLVLGPSIGGRRTLS